MKLKRLAGETDAAYAARRVRVDKIADEAMEALQRQIAALEKHARPCCGCYDDEAAKYAECFCLCH